MSDAPTTATVAVQVAVPPAVAFEVFTQETNLWWRRGRKFRHSADATSTITIEPALHGRVVESWRLGDQPHEFELGRITLWQPPHRFAFTWRNATFAPLEQTDVDVQFQAMGTGCLVTVRHRGWQQLRVDHPARHGADDRELSRSVGLWWGDLMASLREHSATLGC